MNPNQIEHVTLPERNFVGYPVTSVFQPHDPKKIEEVKARFFERRNEIKHVVNPEFYYCPHFSAETVFTYFFCMEVSEIADVPEGMLGFATPSHSYVKTRSDSDPYSLLHQYIRENGKSNNPKALAIEVYPFSDPRWPSNVEVLIPLKP